MDIAKLIPLAACSTFLIFLFWRGRNWKQDYMRDWPGYCENGTAGCRGVHFDNPCAECCYDTHL
jgi:hypothetical protein